MSNQLQKDRVAFVALERSTAAVSVESRPSTRSDHQVMRPECGSAGMIRWVVGPENFRCIGPCGRATYRAAYSWTVVRRSLPTETRSWADGAAAVRRAPA